MTEVIRFSAHHRYQVVVVENVIKIFNWWRFNWWLGEMAKLGYNWKAVISNTQFAPADPHAVPQSRNRVYVVFWREELRTPDLNFTPQAICPRCGVVAAQQVFKNSKNLDGATKFVKFLTSDAEQKILNQAYTTIPPIKAAQTDTAFTSPSNAVIKDTLAKSAASLPQVADESQFETAVGTAIKGLFADAAAGRAVTTASVKAALEKAQQQMPKK